MAYSTFLVFCGQVSYVAQTVLLPLLKELPLFKLDMNARLPLL
jgi:hypothetical protein